MVDQSGAVVWEFCDNYHDNNDLLEIFKKQNGWYDK